MNLKTTLIALAALSAVVLAPATLGQNPNAGSLFGQPIRIGDADYTPVAKGASFLPVFYVADFGGGTDIQKLCVVIASKAATSVANLPPLFSGNLGPGVGANILTSAEATFALRPDELRVAGCPGGVPGSRLGASQASENIVGFTALGTCNADTCTTLTAVTAIQVVDANNDGKYNAGEALFLTYNGDVAAGTLTNGLPATAMGTFGLAAGNTLRFTIRLTSQLGYQAGTFVMAGDADYQQYYTGAAAGATGTKIVAMSAVERDDKAVFLVAGGAGTIPAGGAIFSGSVRMGPVGQAFIFPNIQATKIETVGNIEAGKPFNVIVSLLNGGTGGGPGLLVTKIDSTIVDARMSPPISAAGTDRATIPVTAPCSGSHTLKVNDGFLVINVAGDTPCSAATVDTAALEARIRTLESKAGVNVASAGAPGLAPIALLAVLALGGTILRRRGA